MDDAGLVRLVERAARRDEDGQRPLDGERPLGAHRLVEVLALEELHDDVERAVLELAEHEHLHGVRVRQLAHRARLAPEARHEVLPVGELRVEDLHPHHAVHLGLQRLVDGAHPARADLLEDLELAVQDVASDERVLRAHGRRMEVVSRVGSRHHPRRRHAPASRSTCSRGRLLARLSDARRAGREPCSGRWARAPIVQVKQVHGARAVLAAEADGAGGRRARGAARGACAVGVRVADCVPVLVGGRGERRRRGDPRGLARRRRRASCGAGVRLLGRARASSSRRSGRASARAASRWGARWASRSASWCTRGGRQGVRGPAGGGAGAARRAGRRRAHRGRRRAARSTSRSASTRSAGTAQAAGACSRPSRRAPVTRRAPCHGQAPLVSLRLP